MPKKVLIKNSLIGMIQVIFTTLLTLVSVPVFINKLGLEKYGVFAIISVIGNLNILTNLGLNGALLVYVAQQGKCQESDYDIVTTQIVSILLTLIFSLLFILFSNFIVLHIFHIPKIHFTEAKRLFYLLIVSNAFLIVGQTYTSVIDAIQKIYITNICQFIYSVIYWGGVIATVSFKGGLIQVGFVALGASIVWFLLVFLNAKSLWGKMDLTNYKNHFRRVVRKQFIYGFKIYMSGLIGFLFEPLSKIFLSNFIGLNAVALFEIGTKIRGQITAILTKVLYPIYPYIANAPKSKSLHNKLYDLFKKIQLVVIPVSVISIFVLPILMKLWLGGDNFKQVSVFTITLTVSLLLLSPPVMPIYLYLAGKGMAEKNIWIQLSSVLVNVIVFFALLNTSGIYAILFSNTFAYISSYLMCNYFQYKYLGVNFRQDRYYYLKLLIFGMASTFVCIFIRSFVPVSPWDLIIYPIVVGSSFILFVRMQKLLNNDDLELYFDLMPFLKKRLIQLLIS